MKKRNTLFAVVMAALMMCLLLVGCGAKNAQSGQEQLPTLNVEKEVTAANEQELREYLAADTEQVIHLTGEVTVREGFIVNGKKTLAGDGILRMSLDAELGQALLSVTENSALTLDGPVLDCNYNSDGIHVAQNATLTSLSGTIQYAGAYGILSYGKVDIEDINIEKSMYIAICGQAGSEAYMKGGSILRSSYNHVYLVTGAYMQISGDTLMEGSYEQGIINYGTLDIHGGKFGETYGYTCDNHGVLNVEYKGDQENGYIEAFGSRKSTFLSRKGSTTNISDVYIHDTRRQGISSLGGDTVISNCKIENSGTHSIDIQNGKATITDVVVKDAKGSGLETRTGAKVELLNFTVDGCGNIGIACRGAEITGNHVNISNTERYGMSCGDSGKGHGRLIVKNAKISGAVKQGIYLYDNGRGEFTNIEIKDGASRGIIVKATSTATISGNSVIKNMALGGVEVHGTLTANSLVICNNNSSASGAGVYVGAGGKATINGGAIYNNRSAVRGGGVCVTDGTITINGTQIYNNHAVKHGGGIYVQKASLVSLKSGTVTNNRTDSYGDGIYILSADSQVKIAENVYLGGNDIKIDDPKAYVKFTGSTMKHHSAKDPVLLTPDYDAPEGTVVGVCNSDSIAKNIAVASGDGSYELLPKGKNIVIQYAVADMDMTGADTVSVSNFEQLKAAVETTTSKRHIILKSDIAFPERIRLPGGVTISIEDDGTPRALTRAEGYTGNLLVTHYGTGLYLNGTQQGNLVLDGTCSDTAATVQPLVRTAGSTVLNNAVLQNNGSPASMTSVKGALLKQCYGDFQIYNSVLSGGQAYSGGAIALEKGTGYIEGTLIKDNQSAFGGAGIRVESASQLEVVDSRFEINHSGTAGGGIVAIGASKVTVTDTAFENNTATERGGALCAQDEGTQIKFIGTDSNAVFKNNSAEIAGAVYVVSKAKLEVTGYTFENNTAVENEDTEKPARAGAVCILGDSSAIIKNSEFYGNKADTSGGAVVVDAGKADIISCAFGKEGAGNVAGDKAGAILVTAGGSVKMTTEEDGAHNSAKYNTAKGVGGVFYVNEDSSLEIENYIFEGNKGSSGGAVYIHAGGTVVAKNNQFIENTAISGETYGNGGAVFCEGSYTDTDSSYSRNKAKNGGAVIVMKGGNATLTGTDTAKAVMQGNEATVNGGAAVYVNTGANATVTGYTFDGNTGANGGSIQVHTGGKLALNNAVFNGASAAKIYVLGSLNFNDITNVNLVAAGEKAEFVVSGYESGNTIEFTPYVYAPVKVLHKADGLAEATFKAACKAIKVTPESNTGAWYIDEAGQLTAPAVATITVNGEEVAFSSLKEAVAYVNKNGGTGDAAALEIVVLMNATVSDTLKIQKNAAIVNTSGKDVTISRGTQDAFDMFVVAENATLTLGTDNVSETGKLTVDGATTDAIKARTVTVNAGAGFVLAKNATLCNANTSSKTGAAVYTESANVKIFGTIRDNVTTNNGGGMYVDANAGAEKIIINGAVFSGNQGGAAAGGLYIEAGAAVSCENATFSGNKGFNGTTYANAGAVFVAGTFEDTNSTYTGNQAKNGGAVIVMKGGKATLTGTDAAKAVMQSNTASTNYGGAVFVNGGGEATITGYTLTGNTSGGIQVQKNATATLNDLTFTGTGNGVYVNGTLTFNNLTGAKIVQAASDASITVSGYQTGNVIEFTPYAYDKTKVVLNKVETMEEDTFKAACAAITVTQESATSAWYITEEGKLAELVVATITTGDTTKEFSTFKAAIDYVNENGGTGTAAALEIVLSKNVAVNETLTIQKNVAIVNTSGETVTISRGAALTADMFTVREGASLTLGRADSGALIIDGTSASAVEGRTVTVASGATFTLNKNATLCNANSTLNGGALQTSGTTCLYGTISGNYSKQDGAGVEVYAGTVEIDGAIFSGNSAGKTGAAMCIRDGATVECENATFENNIVPGDRNAGAVYVAGTFTDTNSSYTGNKAKNGGAIFLGASTAKVTLKGTDSTKAIFSGNIATGATNSRGGAIFVNSGGSLTVDGYTFEGNTSTGTDANTAEGAIHVANGSATVKNATFKGTVAQYIYVNKSLTFENLTGAKIVQAVEGASITLSGSAGTNVSVKPAVYEVGKVVVTGTGVDFTTIAVTQTSDGNFWFIDESGKLAIAAAGVTAGGATKYHTSLAAALADAGDGAQIEVLVNTTLTETVTISQNITIVNASGKTVTISRGSLTANMFTVESGSLTLGRSADGGALVIDGASESAIAGRTVNVASGATFTLNKNATLCNANSTEGGAALNTLGTAYLYGTISYNKSQSTGAGVVVGGSANVTCVGATFQGNDSTANTRNGGAVYVAGKYTDNGSRYIGNKSKNGGAIFTGGDKADVEIENATFEGNQVTANGAAIFVNAGTLTVRNSTFTGNTKTDGNTVNTIHRAKGTLYIGVDVVVDGTAQEVTEPASEG